VTPYTRRRLTVPHYIAVGEIPRKRHTQFRQPDGSLYCEELMGEEGFSSDSSLLYHRTVPSAITASRAWELPDLTTTPNHPLRPRHLKLHALAPEPSGDVVTGRRLVLGNGDVRISYAHADAPSPLYRNATGTSASTSSPVRPAWTPSSGRWTRSPVTTSCCRAGPRTAGCPTGRCGRTSSRRTGTSARPSATCPSTGSSSSTRRTASATCGCRPRRCSSTDGDVEVFVKHRVSGGIGGSVVTHARSPFDVVGWDGCLYPWVFNVRDFEPITGRVHQPPPVHQVLEGPAFVVCNFVPRKVDYHPLAVPVPYYHSNVDSDEVMFYVAGDYEARKGSGIERGSISLHPGGHAHGPQPGAAEASLGADFFDELAVMVDTFRPLELGEGGRACEDDAYAWSWAR
jgi:homogentisate 1,2-dioxygenase